MPTRAIDRHRRRRRRHARSRPASNAPASTARGRRARAGPAVEPRPRPQRVGGPQRPPGAPAGEREHTETSPVMTAGDVDADWEDAYSVGDEAPGRRQPDPGSGSRRRHRQGARRRVPGQRGAEGGGQDHRARPAPLGAGPGVGRGLSGPGSATGAPASRYQLRRTGRRRSSDAPDDTAAGQLSRALERRYGSQRLDRLAAGSDSGPELEADVSPCSQCARQYRYFAPRRYISRSTSAGDASKWSSRVLVRISSKPAPGLSTAVVPSRPDDVDAAGGGDRRREHVRHAFQPLHLIVRLPVFASNAESTP